MTALATLQRSILSHSLFLSVLTWFSHPPSFKQCPLSRALVGKLTQAPYRPEHVTWLVLASMNSFFPPANPYAHTADLSPATLKFLGAIKEVEAKQKETQVRLTSPILSSHSQVAKANER